MEVQYVPETMPLQALMQRLIRHKSNIAVVIDEFGGTAGIISLEDVLEQIFGEIEDEHDVRPEKPCVSSILRSRFCAGPVPGWSWRA